MVVICDKVIKEVDPNPNVVEVLSHVEQGLEGPPQPKLFRLPPIRPVEEEEEVEEVPQDEIPGKTDHPNQRAFQVILEKTESQKDIRNQKSE